VNMRQQQYAHAFTSSAVLIYFGCAVTCCSSVSTPTLYTHIISHVVYVYMMSYVDAASAVDNKEANLVLLGDKRHDEARFNLPQTVKKKVKSSKQSRNKTLK
jgi:hypothetical protein